MPFDVSEFRAQMIGDGARPNLFEVSMPYPGFSSPGAAMEKMTFMAKSAQLPGSSIGVVQQQYFGRELKFAGNRVFQDWSVNVINDEDFVIRNALERWLNGINSHTFNIRAPGILPPASYTVDSNVLQYGKMGDVIKKYKFIGMFPVDVSPIDVDWGANDVFEEFSVTFAYQWWTSEEDGVI